MGVFLEKGRTALETYGFFMRPVLRAGQIHISCLNPGCLSKDVLRVTYDNKLKITNFVRTHLCTSTCPNATLTMENYLSMTGGAPIPAEVAEVRGGVKRPAAVTLSKTDTIGLLARTFAIDGRPFVQVENPGFTEMLEAFGQATCTRGALEHRFAQIYAETVERPRAELIKAATKPKSVTVDGVEYEFRRPLVAAADGWTARSGVHMQSLTVTGAQLVGSPLLGGIELRPHSIPVALRHFDVPRYTAINQAAFFVTLFESLLLPAMLIWAWVMDNTSTNPAMARLPPWDHTLFNGCAQHKGDLTLEDLEGNAFYVEAYNAANWVTVWFRASDKRMKAFETTHKAVKVGQRIRKPMSSSATRFSGQLLIIHRALELFPILTEMHSAIVRGEPIFSDAGTIHEFNVGYTNFSLQIAELRAINRLGAAFLHHMPRLGSEKEYTSSLQAPLFDALRTPILREIGEATALGPAGEKSLSIAKTLHQSVFRRLAPVRFIENNVICPPGVILTALERSDRLKLDDAFNTAAALDPANFKSFTKFGGNFNDMVAHTFTELKLRATRKAAFVAPVPDAATVAALNLEVAAIKALKKESDYVSDAQHAETLAELERVARERYRTRHDGLRAELEADPFGPLYKQLVKEVEILKGLHKAESAAENIDNPSIYGLPLDQGNKPRYRFWPSRRLEMPLLFEAAWSFLAGLPAASTLNERMHSVSGRIASKLRSTLKPDSIERLTLAFYFLKDAVKKKQERIASILLLDNPELIDYADLDEILDAEVSIPTILFDTLIFPCTTITIPNTHPFPLTAPQFE